MFLSIKCKSVGFKITVEPFDFLSIDGKKKQYAVCDGSLRLNLNLIYILNAYIYISIVKIVNVTIKLIERLNGVTDQATSEHWAIIGRLSAWLFAFFPAPLSLVRTPLCVFGQFSMFNRHRAVGKTVHSDFLFIHVCVMSRGRPICVFQGRYRLLQTN